MKQRFLKHVLLLTLVLFLNGLLTESVYAQDVYFSFTDPSVLVGETVSVTINSSAPVGGVSMTIVYDAEALTYTGYTGGMGNITVNPSLGSISFTDFDSKTEAWFSLTLNFKAQKVGTTKITTSSGSASDAGGDLMDAGFGNSTISVTAASADTTLSSLYIDPGVLSPTFSPNVYQYSAAVENGSTYITVAAHPNDPYATAYVDGHASLREGQNTVTVTVTAGNGTQSVYTIQVTRKALTSTPVQMVTPTPTPQSQPANENTAIPTGGPAVTLPDGAILTITSYEAEDIPSDFMAATIHYQGVDIPAVISNDGLYLAVYLRGDKDHPTAFYLFDDEKGTARAMNSVTVSALSCTILDANDYPGNVPDNCSLGSYKFDGEPYRVFVPQDSAAEYIVLYGEMNGEKCLYQYDKVQKTIQRYGLVVVEKEVEIEIEREVPVEDNTQELEQTRSQLETSRKEASKYKTLAIIVSVIAIIILLSAAVLTFVLLRDRRRDGNNEWP